jgi:energy-coupling factor transporter ATP-binding protein EcfA2
MQERLVIKNFGPIKSADLELGMMTILIGDQATGKSTIAKVLAVCRFFSFITDSTNKLIKNKNIYFDPIFKDFGIDNCITEASFISYENEHYQVKIEIVHDGRYISDFDLNKNQPFLKFQPKIIANVSNRFKELILKFNIIKPNNDFGDILSQYMFTNWDIPLEFLQNEVGKVLNNPLLIPIERIVQSISFNKDLLLSEATQDQLRKLRRIAMNYSNPTEIPVLNLNFYSSNGLDFVKRKEEESFYKLAESASGWQLTTPIVLGVKYYNEIKPKVKTFIIEEAENNLFPKTQKRLVEFFVENINNYGHQFILPTHSPYILSALNNCLYAYNLSKIENGKYNKEIEKIIPKENWLNIDDLSVYYLEKGEAKNILNREEGLIDIDDLDSVSRDINKVFDELLTIEMQYED